MGIIYRLVRFVDTKLLPVLGPSHVGIGRPEAVYVPPANPTCPLCGGLMAEHTVFRSADQAHSTRLICPPKTVDAAVV